MKDPMDTDTNTDDSNSTRLSRITTLWSQFQAAHEESDEAVGTRNSLLLRYRGAIRRYLTAAVRDSDQADDLFHEFSIRFLQGDFHRANPTKGRFRDYVRTVLINLVNDHFRNSKKHKADVLDTNTPAITPAPDTSLDETGISFEQCLRDELMAQTWQRLAETNQTFALVLRLRVNDPILTSRQISEQLTAQGSPISSANVRKTVQRARSKFAELFLDEVRGSLEFDSDESMVAELKRLGLLDYVQGELERRGIISA